jgi:biotin carboxyl carrier protein
MKWVVRGHSKEWEVTVEATPDGLEVVVDGRRRLVDLAVLAGSASLRFCDDGASYHVVHSRGQRRRWEVAVGPHDHTLEVLTPVEAVARAAAAEVHGPSRIEAPIPGKVVVVGVAPGDVVAVGQTVVVLEAMKMENELVAEQGGTVKAVHVAQGATVEAGALLVELE